MLNRPGLLLFCTTNVSTCPASFAGPALISVAKAATVCGPASSATVGGAPASTKLGASFTSFTVSVKACVTGLPTPLLAVMVSGNVPPAAAVPASVAVPSPLSTNVTPAGSVPVTLSAGVGVPCVVTVKVPGTSSVNVVDGGAGKRRRLVHGQRKALHGRCADAVGRRELEREGTRGSRRPAQRRGAVAVVRERDARRQRAGRERQRRDREAGRRDGERAGRADEERCRCWRW